MENLLFIKKENTVPSSFVHKTTTHWISYLNPIIMMIIGGIGIIFLIMFLTLNTPFGIMEIISIALIIIFFRGLLKFLYLQSVKVYITSTHFIVKTGYISKTVIDIPLNKRENVSLYQTFLGRIFNYGTFIISTGGVTLTYTLKNPIELRNKILKQI